MNGARTIRAAFAISILLHALLLWDWLPAPALRPSEKGPRLGAGVALAVRLSPAPSRPAAASVAAMPASAPVSGASAHSPRAGARKVLASAREAPAKVAPARPAAAPSPLAGEDFAAFVAARRRAREAAAPPSAPAARAESEQERDNRQVAANLGLDRAPGFGSEDRRGGGMFELQRVSGDEAEFLFFGWNGLIRRNARQMISVQRGDNPTLELAVVRRMIAIIREHESGDFVWESQRLHRDVTLSARQGDNAGLEDFLLREFFSAGRPPG